MSEPVQVIATLYPKDTAAAQRIVDHNAQIKELLLGVSQKVRDQEPDVLRYQINEQLAKEGPPLLVMTETYRTSAAIKKHGQMPYFVEFGETLKKEGLVSKPMTLVMTRSIGGFESRL